MHRSPRGQAGDLLGDSGERCGRHTLNAVLGRCFVGVVEQHRREALAHVPFEVIGEHAEEDLRAVLIVRVGDRPAESAD